MAGRYNYVELHKRSPIFRDSAEFRQHGELPVDFALVDYGDLECAAPATGDFCLGIVVSPVAREFWADFGEGRRHFVPSPGHIGFLYPTENDTWYRVVSKERVLLISAPKGPLAKALMVSTSELTSALRPLHDTLIEGQELRRSGLRMWEMARMSGRFSSLAVEHSLIALVAELLLRARKNHCHAVVRHQSAGALTQRQLNKVVEVIDGRLAQTIGLADLAAATGLSLWHFARAFKATTGVSPHRYVMAYRIKRAKALLRSTQRPVTEIAHDCGFASSQHLATVFRRQVGVTPTAFRRNAYD